MKIWSLENPFDYRFAWAILRGTWYPPHINWRDVCPECKASRQQERIKPLVIEWEPGSDVIGDFVWASFSEDVAITERTLHALQKHFQGFEPGPVEMVQDPRLKKPKRPTKRTKPRVWLPYEGPPLYDLRVTRWVHLDREKSTVRLIKKCGTCGRESFEVTGIETRKTTGVDLERGELLEQHIPRTPGQGIYVHAADLEGADVFRVFEVPGMIRCTDRIKEFIEREGFTNVSFWEVGDLM